MRKLKLINIRKILFILLLPSLITSLVEANEITFIINFQKEKIFFEKYQDYDIVGIDGLQFSRQVANPMLPIKILHFVIPQEAEIKNIKIIATQSEELEGNFYIYPAQQSIPYTKAKEVTFTKPNNNIYSSSIPYPEQIVQSYGNGFLRGINIATIVIYPLQYLPNLRKLTFYHKIEFRIQYKSTQRAKRAIPFISVEKEYLFNEWVKKIVSNPEDINRYYNQRYKRAIPKETLWEYIIITCEEFKDAFLPLSVWKTKKGIPTKIVTTSSIADNYSGVDIQEKIRNFIIDAYINHGAKWVLLGGDTDIVPHRIAYGMEIGSIKASSPPSDLYYSDLDRSWDDNGNGIYGEVEDGIDMYPDVFVGRAPVNSIDDVNTFINKVITYEKQPPLTNYPLKALFLGAFALGMNIGERMKEKIDKESIPPRFEITKLYNKGLTHDTALSELNSGYNLINHIDHANTDVLCTGAETDGGKITIEEVDNLVNSPKYSILWSVGCYPAAIDDDCIAEHFVVAPNGGGFFIGNSRYGLNPESDTYLDPEFYRSLFIDNLYHIGQTLADSKIPFIGMAQEANGFRYVLYELNLLGDPEMPIWTDTPATVTVSYPPIITVGAINIPITIQADNRPVKDILVCLSKNDEVYTYGYTDKEGIINFNVKPFTKGTLSITVTGQNFLPYEDTITVIPSNVPFVQYKDCSIDDNEDGIINPKETIKLRLYLKNYGSQTAMNVNATLSSSDNRITIIDKTANYNNIPYQTIATSTTEYSFKVSENISSLTPIIFTLHINSSTGSWTDSFKLPIATFITGRVIDAKTDIGIASATVSFSCSRYGTVSTKENGYYKINIYKEGKYTLSVNAYGYNLPLSKQYILPPEVSNVNFNLTYARIRCEPISFDIFISQGTSTTKFIDIYNDGNNDLEGSLFVNPIGTKSIALISDDFQLGEITSILKELGFCYEILNNNRSNKYTEDLKLLSEYSIVIFYNEDRAISEQEYNTLENYLQSGGSLLVTGYDSLANPNDKRLAKIVRSKTSGEHIHFEEFKIINSSHPITNGPYGRYLEGEKFNVGDSCHNNAEADTDNGAITIAQASESTYDKIIATYLDSGGKVVYWNGNWECYDWRTEYASQELVNIFKNTLAWLSSPNWLNISTTTAHITPNLSKKIEVRFATNRLKEGTYSAIISIYSNDPINNIFPIPVTMNITPAINIRYNSYIIAQDTNRDNVASPGEKIKLSIILKNIGGATATQVFATLSTQNRYINMTKPTAEFGTINPYGTATCKEDFEFEIANDCPKDYDVIFNLMINNYWQETFKFKVLEVPDIEVHQDNLIVELKEGTITQRSLNIANKGPAELLFYINDKEETATLAEPKPEEEPAEEIEAEPEPESEEAPETSRLFQPSVEHRNHKVWGKMPFGEKMPSSMNILNTTLPTSKVMPVIIMDANEGDNVDITRVEATTIGSQTTIKIIFNHPFDRENTVGYISFDIDQNQNTGRMPSYGLPEQDIGVEFEASLFDRPNIRIINTSTWEVVGEVLAVCGTDSLCFSIPLSLLNNDDGYIDITMVLGDLQRPLDWAPDVGHGTIEPIGWLYQSPTYGILNYNANTDIIVTFDANEVKTGTYTATINLYTNDPDENPTIIPVTMIVKPNIVLRYYSHTIKDYGNGDGVPNPNEKIDLVVVLKNAGSNKATRVKATIYEVDDYIEVTSDKGYFGDIAGVSMAKAIFAINILSNCPNNHIATFTLKITDSENNLWIETFAINIIWTPDIELNTHKLNITLPQGKIATQTLTISNTGIGDLILYINPIALISDNSQLEKITHILNDMNLNFDIFNNNRMNKYTQDISLLSKYKTVIFYNQSRAISEQEYNTLENYLQSGGNLLVTGYDSLGCPDDKLLAKIVRSSTTGDNVGDLEIIVRNDLHPIMNGSYGYFSTGTIFTAGHTDHDQAEADINRGAVTIAEIVDDTYDKIIATELDSGGKVVYWNGNWDCYDWSTEYASQELVNIFKNTLVWLNLPVWLSIQPNLGTLTPKSSTDIIVRFDSQELKSGTYSTQLLISNNDPDEGLLQIPVTMNIIPAINLKYAYYTIEDGNNDGLPNPNEEVYLLITLKNAGELFVKDGTAAISTNDQYINFIYNTTTYTQILPNTTATLIFKLSIAKGCPDEHIATFTLNISDLEYAFTITIFGLPKMSLSPTSIDIAIPEGSVTTKEVTISNAGNGKLVFNISHTYPTSSTKSNNFIFNTFDNPYNYSLDEIVNEISLPLSPSSVISPYTSIIPKIDGIFLIDEWQDALSLSATLISNPKGREIGKVYVKNNLSHLYILIDYHTATEGDKEWITGDVWLDLNNDGKRDGGFYTEIYNGEVYTKFSFPGVVKVSNTPSNNNPINHWIIEYEIPLSGLDISCGDKIGIHFVLYDYHDEGGEWENISSKFDFWYPNNWADITLGNWLTVTPSYGTVSPTATLPITVNIQPSGFTSGTYTANIEISTNEFGKATSTIPLILHLTPAKVIEYHTMTTYEYLGNKDGKINPKEKIEMSVTIINSGSMLAPNIKGSISSTSEYIELIDRFIQFGSLTKGATATGKFKFLVKEDCPDYHIATFTLTLIDAYQEIWDIIIPIMVTKASNIKFTIEPIQISLNKGECGTLSITISNYGNDNLRFYAGVVRDEVISLPIADKICLISDLRELEAITPILDVMKIKYDILNNNAKEGYTTNYELLSKYKVIIWYCAGNDGLGRRISKEEAEVINRYLFSGGNLLITGYDTLGDPADPRLASIIGSSEYGDGPFTYEFIVKDDSHTIMAGPYGSFTSGSVFRSGDNDHDKAKAKIMPEVTTIAELEHGYAKILINELPVGGKVIYWNGNKDCVDWLPQSKVKLTSENKAIVKSPIIIASPELVNILQNILYWLTPPKWVDVYPNSGTITVNSQLELNLSFNSSILSIGKYPATLLIKSNDPVENLIEIPITMNIYEREIEILGPKAMAVDGSITLYAKVIGTDTLTMATWTITSGTGTLSTPRGTSTIFTATEVGKVIIKADDGTNTATIMLIVGHQIDTSTTWGTTTKLSFGTVTIQSGTSSIEIYILPPKSIPQGTFTHLANNIGIGIELNAYGTSGDKLGTLTSPIYVEIYYDEGRLGKIDEETLILWVSSDGINWNPVKHSGRDSGRNIVFGTITHLSYIAPAGELKFAKDLSKAFAYPNPYYASKHDYIYFDGLTENSVIKIFTIAGELVKEIHVERLPQRWDVCNESGNKVASGIYIYLIKDPAGNKKVGKLGVIK